jgi:two-component system chemotaxis response regulator CheY
MDKHILLVDDSPTIRSSASQFLRKAGYRVTEAVNGRDGLEKLKSIREGGETPSLILTDVNMPEMDGIAFIQAVKGGDCPFIPILVLTTESEEAMITKGKAAGASGWLLKPFNPDQLGAAIRKLLWQR